MASSTTDTAALASKQACCILALLVSMMSVILLISSSLRGWPCSTVATSSQHSLHMVSMASSCCWSFLSINGQSFCIDLHTLAYWNKKLHYKLVNSLFKFLGLILAQKSTHLKLWLVWTQLHTSVCIFRKVNWRILINFYAKQNTTPVMYLPQYEICLTIFWSFWLV